MEAPEAQTKLAQPTSSQQAKSTGTGIQMGAYLADCLSVVGGISEQKYCRYIESHDRERE